MRGLPVKILVCLSIGAVATIAIAWLSSLFINVESLPLASSHYEGFAMDGVSATHTTDRWSSRTAERVRIDFRWDTFGPKTELSESRIRQALIDWRWTTPPSGQDLVLIGDSRGWPLSALEGAVVQIEPGAGQAQIGSQWCWAFESTTPTAPSRTGIVILPLRPIWPGFVIDSILLSVAAGLVLYGRLAVRIALRWWRGSCIRCGYPAATGAHCPECGVPYAKKRPA